VAGGRDVPWFAASRRRTLFVEKLVNHTPLFFVSVASKGLSQPISLLFATLAGGSISVAAKGLKEEGERK
jgi:hypothetical protein